MNSVLKIIKNEKGSALLIAMVSLFILTLIGIMAINNTGVELQIAGNDRLSKLSFFTAESARSYVIGHPELYNFNNTEAIVAFPNVDNTDGVANQPATEKDIAGNDIPVLNTAIDADEDGVNETYYCLDGNACTQKIKGDVIFLSANDTTKTPPRGSGFSVGDYSANVYRMRVEGYFDPFNNGNFISEKHIEQHFYRIGL